MAYPYRDDASAQPQQGYDNSNVCMGETPASPRSRPSPLEEMEKRQAHNSEEGQKLYEGTSFLRRHPEFNEFIHLIRTGAIGI
jgi:hypothetical protein